MDTKKIDILNVILIFVSLLLAFKIPFELFLFSYAVLGPLHYLTEINWLNEKKYFVKNKTFVVLLVAFAFFVSIPFLLRLPFFDSFIQTSIGSQIKSVSSNLGSYFIFISFIFSIGLIYLKKWWHILLFLVGAVLLSILVIKNVPFSVIMVSVFIPTIIHVYLFTMLFMIFGTLSKRTGAGVFAIIALVLCPFIIMLARVNPDMYQLSENVKSSYTATDFSTVTTHIADIFHLRDDDGQFYLLSVAGIKIQVFVAFAYTYHYLNWFSKTSIIGWHRNVSKKKLIAVIVVWLLSVSLYYYDYKIGLLTLFFLSLLHVLLEFPLNIVSVKTIVQKIIAKKAT